MTAAAGGSGQPHPCSILFWSVLTTAYFIYTSINGRMISEGCFPSIKTTKILA